MKLSFYSVLSVARSELNMILNGEEWYIRRDYKIMALEALFRDWNKKKKLVSS